MSDDFRIPTKNELREAIYKAHDAEIARLQAELTEVREEYAKLRDAVRRIGFSVMQTSGEWSIHGVREYDQRMEADDLQRVKRIIELESDLAESVKLLRPAVQAGGMLVAMLTDFRDQWKDDEFKAAWYKSAIGRFNAASEFLNTHDAARAGRGEGERE